MIIDWLIFRYWECRNLDKGAKLFIDAINKMMRIAGYKKRYNDLKHIPNWYTKYTMTSAEQERLGKWYVKKAMRRMKVSPNQADRMWQWFNLGYGLRVKDER